MNEPDSFVAHKFKPISEQLYRTLETSEIYFASPMELNDPFDCQIDLSKARKLALLSCMNISTAVEEGRWGVFSKNLIQKARSCGVFSLCGGEVIGHNSHLFWPHYGDSHKGVCLTYRIPTSYVEGNHFGIDRVKYSSESLFEAINNLRLEPLPTMPEIHPLIIAMLTTKSGQWAYEEEVRMVAFESGPKPIPRDCLVQVCFGLKVSARERQRLITAMHGWGYQGCTYAETHIAEDGLFDLAIRK